MEGKPSMKEEDFSVFNDTGRGQAPEGADAVGAKANRFLRPAPEMIEDRASHRWSRCS